MSRPFHQARALNIKITVSFAGSLKQMGISAVNVRPARMLPAPDELSVEICLYPITKTSCHSKSDKPQM
ncbi:hypothetical protein IRJ41_019031 [Triplophysa rosa]|uniref:Uncharacterized protein n=1 Tax=Triplophysa rosa TaxID=992332 RepID=A0A9W7WC74_TRIRA|nr:hypothetical protein IRJ41_019031 [Triplophysa rosa]